MIPKVPCKNCKIRHFGCHSDCDDYLIYKSEMERQRKLRLDEREKINFHIKEKGRLL